MKNAIVLVALACACTTGGSTDAAKRCDNLAKAIRAQEALLPQLEALCPGIADDEKRRVCEIGATSGRAALEAQKVVYDAECSDG